MFFNAEHFCICANCPPKPILFGAAFFPRCFFHRCEIEPCAHYNRETTNTLTRQTNHIFHFLWLQFPFFVSISPFHLSAIQKCNCLEISSFFLLQTHSESNFGEHALLAFFSSLIWVTCNLISSRNYFFYTILWDWNSTKAERDGNSKLNFHSLQTN